MKSKLIITLTAFFIFAGILSAQDEKPFRLGVIGGMNLSNVKADLDNRVGFHAGVKAEYALPLDFYLESGLLFTRKGYKAKFHITDAYGSYGYGNSYGDYELETPKTKYGGCTNKYMLELPILIGYKLELHKGISIFASGGGYIGYGLFGKYKGTLMEVAISAPEYPITEYPSLGEMPNTSYEVKFTEGSQNVYGSPNNEKRFDWGLGVKAGVELFERLQISASYDWGMNKLYSETSEGNNRNFMVSCAFMIW